MKITAKIREWREKSKDSLNQEIIPLKEKLRSLRFQLSSGKIKNNHEIQQTKKDIARILTIVKQK